MHYVYGFLVPTYTCCGPPGLSDRHQEAKAGDKDEAGAGDAGGDQEWGQLGRGEQAQGQRAGGPAQQILQSMKSFSIQGEKQDKKSDASAYAILTKAHSGLSWCHIGIILITQSIHCNFIIPIFLWFCQRLIYLLTQIST